MDVKKIPSLILGHPRTALEVLGLSALLIFGLYYRHEALAAREAVNKAKTATEVAIATKAGAEIAKPSRSIVVRNKKLQPFVKEENKAGAKTTSLIETKVEVKDQAKAITGPSFIEDEYGRFHFELPNGPLTRHQLFQIDAVVLRSADGKYSFVNRDFREFSPKDGSDIPTTGAKVSGNFQFIEEAKPGPKLFHPRVVALIDHRAAVGAGVELLNLKDRVTVGLAGVYSTKEKTGDLIVFPSVRLLNTNLSVGPYYSLRGKFGALATIQVTR